MKAIYKIINTKTKDCYIGSAVNYTYRKWVHLKRLREGKHHSSILQNSWNKHGEDTFLFEVVEEVEDKSKLVEREQYYIDTLNPRYNICKIAGSPLGIKHTYEARTNMSLAHKGKPLKEMGHKEGCNCSVCTRRVGKDHPNFGKPRKVEMRAKISKPIIQYDLGGNIIREWISIAEAGRVLEISASHIGACCRGVYGRKTYKKFIWKFKI